MKNWKTTLSALVAVISGFVCLDPQFFPLIVVSIAKYIALGGLASLGFTCKDSDMTGGSRSQPTVSNPPSIIEGMK